MGRLWLIVTCTAFLAAGCGGSGDTGSDQPTAPAGGPVTKEQFIAQADAACKRFDERLRALARAGSFDDIVRSYRESAKEARAFYDDFRAIPKPPADEQLLARYQRVLSDSIRVTEQGSAAIAGTDRKRFRDLTTEAGRLSRENTRIARRYGFKVCGGTVSK
jgi:hypothetical protein